MLCTVTYTARRSVLAGHVEGGSYVLPVLLSELPESFETVRDVARGDGGLAEVTLDRIDALYQLNFAPVRGADLLALREFLDSTEAGEAFRVVPFGDHTVLTLKRLDAGHQEEVFIRTGQFREDRFTASINAVLAQEDAAPVDIYNPVYGGGLGEPPAMGGVVGFTSANIGSGSGSSNGGAVWGVSTFEWAALVSGAGTYGVGGSLDSGNLAGYTSLMIATRPGTGTYALVRLRVPTSELRANPQTAYFTDVTVPTRISTQTAASATAFATAVDGSHTIIEWAFERLSGVSTMAPAGPFTATFT